MGINRLIFSIGSLIVVLTLYLAFERHITVFRDVLFVQTKLPIKVSNSVVWTDVILENGFVKHIFETSLSTNMTKDESKAIMFKMCSDPIVLGFFEKGYQFEMVFKNGENKKRIRVPKCEDI